MKTIAESITAISNQPKPIEGKRLSVAPQSQAALLLKNGSESKKALAARLYRDFYAMKTYGKEPESLDSIISLFNEGLADFPVDKINAAFRLHAQRSAEFPTLADIVGIIRRNGKPTLKESDIIAIRKKDGEDRTGAEWAMLKEWDAQQQEGWRDDPDPQKDAAMLTENLRLRQHVSDLKDEIRRLSDLLREVRVAKGIEPQAPSLAEKVDRTIRAMRESGAPETDVSTFASQYDIAIPGGI